MPWTSAAPSSHGTCPHVTTGLNSRGSVRVWGRRQHVAICQGKSPSPRGGWASSSVQRRPPAPLPEIICPLLTLARHPSRQMTFKRNQQAAEQLSASVGRRWRVLGASVQDPGGRDETEPGGRDETEPGAGAEPCGAGSRRQALGCPSPECQVWAGFATCN